MPREPRARRSSPAAVAVVGLVLAGCGVAGGGGDDPATVRAEIGAACEAATAGRATIPAAADAEAFRAGTFDLFRLLRDVVDAVEGTDPDGAVADEVEALRLAVDDLHGAIGILRTDLESRSYDDVEQDVAYAREQAAAVDAAAAALAVPACTTDALVGDWIDEAVRWADAGQAETQPTGDYATDVQRACDRFAADVDDLGFPVDPVSSLTYVLGLRDALGLLARDVEVLVPPSDLVDAHAVLLDVLDRARDALAPAASGQLDDDELAAFQAELGELVGELTAAFAAVGATC